MYICVMCMYVPFVAFDFMEARVSSLAGARVGVGGISKAFFS